MWLGAGFGASQLLGAQSTAPATAPLFIEQLPSSSGIEWVHDNAMSAEPLPARDDGTGLRVPRLRQRRLDGHLHGQQRAVRLLDAAQTRSATRSTRTIATARSPTSPTRPASRAARSAWASPSATTTTTATPTSSSPRTGKCTLYQNNGDGTFTDVTEKAGPGDARLDHQRRLVRLRQRRQARSVRLQLRRLSATHKHSAATTSSASHYYCIPRVFKPTPSFLLSQQRRRHVHRGRAKAPISRRRSARASASSRPTSTTTAGWICSSPTTPCRTSSS